MNRFHSIFFLFFIIASLSVSAIETKDSKSKAMITVNALAYGHSQNREGQNWIRIVEAFEQEYPGIEIDYELFYDEAYHNRVEKRLNSKDIPDIAYMGPDVRWGTVWKKAGQQFDHRPYLDPNHYDLKLIPPMGPDGEIYEIPMGTSNITTVLYMNRPLVESLGFSTPKKYEDLAAMVSKAKAKGLEVVTIDGADEWAWSSCLLSCITARLSGDPDWISKAVSGKARFTDKEFVDSLKMVERMINDGVISKNSAEVDYGENISKFSNKKALFLIQGQWAAGGIDPEVAENTLMLAWPMFPGEKENMAGYVAAAIQVGYGLTKKGGDNEAVRDGAIKFLRFFYSHEEVTQRLRDGAIVAPILKNYQVPDDLPGIIKQKLALAFSAKYSTVIDTVLAGPPNDALNASVVKIARGTMTPQEVADLVQKRQSRVRGKDSDEGARVKI